MAELASDRIRLALLLAYLYGVLGSAFGIALAPFLQRALPGEGTLTIASLAMLILATTSFALEIALFLVVMMLPAAIATLPLTYAAARWLTLPRWAATLLGVAVAAGLAWPLGVFTMSGSLAFPGRDNIVAAVLGGACLAQPIWRRCMRPRLDAAEQGASGGTRA